MAQVARAPRKEARNTYRLPQGKALRLALRDWFRKQREAVLKWLSTGKKDTSGQDLPGHFPEWDWFGLGNLPMSERMTPILEATWDSAGAQFTAKIGLDPNQWDVTNPKTQEAIDRATLAFCEETNATTTLELDEALKKTREALGEGLITHGESVADLTKRVKRIFDGAETWRARRIATSETSRAVHAAQELQGQESGVVLGWEWLLSEDACPLCQTVGRRAKFVKIGQPFAIVGSNPTYATIKHPPLHPSCCLPETPVVAPVGIAGIVAQYDGPVVRLVFSDGTDVTVTPNHMLLTLKGFAFASSLMEGDEVIRYCGSDGMSLDGPDDHDKPIPIKDVVSALAEPGRVSAGSVPVSPEYLHGDAAFCDGHINVVTTNRLLWDRLDSPQAQGFAEGSLHWASMPASLFDGHSHLVTVLVALRDATDGGMGSRRERKARLGGRGLVSQGLSTRIGPGRDPRLHESAANDASADAQRLSECLFRFPGEITTAKVVHVDADSLHYTGPVYDVQTLTSLYLLGNGIASSNCQCSMVPVLDIDEPPAWADTLHQPEPEAQDYAEGETPEKLSPRPKQPPPPKAPPKERTPRRPGNFETHKDVTGYLRSVLPTAAIDGIERIPVKVWDNLASEVGSLAKKYPEVANRLQELTTFSPEWDGPHAQHQDYIAVADAGHGRTIRFNPLKHQDAEKILHTNADAEREGWRPPGTGNPYSTVTHEWGHLVDAWISSDGGVIAWHSLRKPFMTTTEKGGIVVDAKKAVSIYARTNDKEAVAEAFSALRWTPTRERSEALREFETNLNTAIEKIRSQP